MNPLFNNYQLPTKKKGGSKRADLIKEIYQLYEEDEIGRKKENWKRYIQWLKQWSIRHTTESQKRFTKTSLYIRKVKINSFCYLISHVQEKDLYYILSVAKDNKSRGFNVSGYIASHFSKITK